MFNNKLRKIDLSFLNYLNEDDINSKQITIEQIKKDCPYLAKSNLGCLEMFLILNYKNLSDDEKQEIAKKINYLREQEEQKFINAFKYIEECQKQQESSQC
jgi:hypothetical protein